MCLHVLHFKWQTFVEPVSVLMCASPWVLGLRGPAVPPSPCSPPWGARPPRSAVSARGQLCLGLRLRRSRCITERKIPPDGGLGLLLFSQGAVPLARPIFNIKVRPIFTRKSIYCFGRWSSIRRWSWKVSVLWFSRVLCGGKGDGAQIKDGGRRQGRLVGWGMGASG